MTETTYPRPLVEPIRRDIRESDSATGYNTMEWCTESDVVRVRWIPYTDAVGSTFHATMPLTPLRAIYWIMPPMRRKTAMKVLNAAADLIAEGRIREVDKAMLRIWDGDGEFERYLGRKDAS
ncbi:MAG: hypothetical protein KDB26_12615 [Microthrixaceae bacterium]|nr:hypothetical protein [Microthrixaceae bacterium]